MCKKAIVNIEIILKKLRKTHRLSRWLVLTHG